MTFSLSVLFPRIYFPRDSPEWEEKSYGVSVLPLWQSEVDDLLLLFYIYDPVVDNNPGTAMAATERPPSFILYLSRHLQKIWRH